MLLNRNLIHGKCRISTVTGVGGPPRNFSPYIMQHAAELIVFQRTWPPSVGTCELSDQQHVLDKHGAMRSSPAPKHDACVVVSEDTIAIAAAVSHSGGENGGAARGCCPRHRRAPPCSAKPLPGLYPSTRQLDERHAGHAIHHAAPRGPEFVTSTNWPLEADVWSRRRPARPRLDTGPWCPHGAVHGLERRTLRGARSSFRKNRTDTVFTHGAVIWSLPFAYAVDPPPL
jgi:hypothetical protein